MAAADMEEQTREIVDARRSVQPVKAGKGNARLLKVVDKSGKVTGYTTHGKVAAAVALAIDVEIAMIDGKRPTHVKCIDCGVLREVKGQTLPKRCAKCAKKAAVARSKDWSRNNPEKALERSRAWWSAHPEQRKTQDAARSKERSANRPKKVKGGRDPEKRRVRERAYRKAQRLANPEKARAAGRIKQKARRAKKKAEREAAKQTK